MCVQMILLYVYLHVLTNNEHFVIGLYSIVCCVCYRLNLVAQTFGLHQLIRSFVFRNNVSH